MKLGVIFFHSNIKNIYRDKWIEKSVYSMINQTIKDLHYYEINYDGESYSVLQNNNDISKSFFSKKLKNYADAMNFIITEAFNDGCDYIFNTNLDDFYSSNRIEKQLEYLEMGFDIVSSDFCYVNADDKLIKFMNITSYGSIKGNLDRNHNMIAHPVVAMSKRFWEDVNNRYDIEKTPSEDMDLWKNSINREYKFYIIDEILLFYRIHNNQVSNK